MTTWIMHCVEHLFMSPDELQYLARLIRDRHVGALGTLREGGPLVSQVVYAPEPELTGYLILASGLAQHTQDFHRDPRVSLMIAESESPGLDPLALARVSLRGVIVSVEEGELAAARDCYLAANPGARMLFSLGDFGLYRFTPRSARFVAGFGRTYNLAPEHFREAAALDDHTAKPPSP
jgi:putative heme iron utilization protein